MAGIIRYSLNVQGLEKDLVLAHLWFASIMLESIGLRLSWFEEGYLTGKADPDIGTTEDEILINIDGERGAFEHRLYHLAKPFEAFSQSLEPIYGGPIDQRYSEEILFKILKACRENVEYLDLISKLFKAQSTTVRVPDSLLDAIQQNDAPDYLVSSVRSLQVAAHLLHDAPFDPTLALITADRALEVLLKGMLGGLRKVKFHKLLDQAKEKLNLHPSEISALKKAHQKRNDCQHDGAECEYWESVEHVQAIISAVDSVWSDSEV